MGNGKWEEVGMGAEFGWGGIDKENTKDKFVIEVLEEKVNYEALIYGEEEAADGGYTLSLKLDEVGSMKEINLDVKNDRVMVSRRSDGGVVFEYKLKFRIDPECLKAGWGKKSHVLKITTKKV